MRALVQVHCHQHADLGFEADREVLAALGVEAEVLDSGCCGLAGNFGFEQGHYEVSQACAERVLYPALRADQEAQVVADGYSCRTQIRQGVDRDPVHLAHLAAAVLTSSRLPGHPSPIAPGGQARRIPCAKNVAMVTVFAHDNRAPGSRPRDPGPAPRKEPPEPELRGLT